MAIGGDAGRVVGDGGAGAGDDNIILNPEFDSGLDNWSGSGCKIELHDSLDDGKVLPVSGKYFVAATGRTDTWNGVQQDVTSRLQRKLLYEVAATVRLSGAAATPSPCEVRATVAVQNTDGRQQYISVAKSPAVSDKEWMQLQGKFLLNGTVAKAAIYIEGPPAGVDLLLDSLVVKHAQKATPAPAPDFKNLEYGANILQNSDLDDGVNGWFGLGSCALSVHGGAPRVLPPMARQSLSPLDGDDGDGGEPLNGKHIHVTNRAQTWMGPAQVITDRVTPYATYQVSAWGACVDVRATPEAYIAQVTGLQEQGAAVGGVGLQGHVTAPVDGVVLWGFWELSMSRDDAHLVDAEGEVNEAGRRLLQLKREWLTRAHGRADGNGEFRFRGHHGAYHVDVVTPAGAKISQEFTVDKDDAPLVLNITV
uniref:CBM-cenC domain-containing protein n=1 Tax=Oryza barthii TaxID=65489 RepID=A0A0D3FMA5_9ORYZ